jgi:hypothetical protein
MVGVMRRADVETILVAFGRAFSRWMPAYHVSMLVHAWREEASRRRPAEPGPRIARRDHASRRPRFERRDSSQGTRRTSS